MNLRVVLITTIAACLSGQPILSQSITWPNGAKAAICLTYDDGLTSHVNNAAPALNKYGLKGTFFLIAAFESVKTEMKKWKALAAYGHELGNHTLYHPCSGERYDWVEKDNDLDKYSLRQITREIRLASVVLKALDNQDYKRTYAYTCGDHNVSGVSFKTSLQPIVSAARNVSNQQTLVSINEVDLYDVQSWGPNEPSLEELISYVDAIIEKETLSTITFHDIGGKHLNVSKENHEALLKYLKKNQDKIWVATFKEATDYLRSQRSN